MYYRSCKFRKITIGFEVTYFMKNFSDEYSTLNQPAAAQIKVKGSRFIGNAFPAQTRDEAEALILEWSKKYYDATHNCFAYRIGLGSDIVQRYSDAGEPAGTAGLPIYQAIEGKDLSDIVVIITRYFGGTKLGKGGLVRAYRDATLAVLDVAEIRKKFLRAYYKINFPYEVTGEVMHLLETCGAEVTDSIYEQSVRLKVRIRLSLAPQLLKKLAEIQYKKVFVEDGV